MCEWAATREIRCDVRFGEQLSPFLESEQPLRLLLRKAITPQLSAALRLDHARKMNQIRESAPRSQAGMMHDFAGARGSRIDGMFDDGSATYLRYVRRKPSEATAAGLRPGPIPSIIAAATKLVPPRAP